jgi:hypothetical protein
MPRYYALINQNGPVKYGQVPSAVGVLVALEKFMAIRETKC